MNSLKSLFPDREGYVIIYSRASQNKEVKIPLLIIGFGFCFAKKGGQNPSPHHRIRILLRKTRRDFMAENNFDSTVASLFKGMDAFISAKTVVGDAVTVKDTIILPLVDVSFGVGAGAFAGDKKNNAGGGMTGKVTPSAVLVIQNGATKLVNIKNQDTVTKILDMIPDVIDKFKGKDEKVVTDADIDAAIEDAAE